MARSSPTSTRRKATKANKSPFVSPGTKKARRRELRLAKERDSQGTGLSEVDIRVLLEELETLGDDNEVALLPKTREELLAELVRRRNRNSATNL
jgi:hypothetical protein